MTKKELTEQQQLIAAGEDANKQVIENSVSPRIVRRNYKPMGSWLVSPAVANPFVTLLWNLEDLAKERKTDLGSLSQVTRVRLARLEDDSRVFLYPTNWDDSQGILLTQRTKEVSFNCYGFFAAATALVETGYAELFSVERAGDDSQVGPALVFDRAHPVNRKLVKKTAKTKKATIKADTTDQTT